eukprot:CAMPEP_0175789324 /NCGR_PEP_ID=MMETSP0097-20121207/81341_1 /TAXON_ID=311494 /ORGANISM="Alexandrium monilatum, Strain CCMP3105" /LENGTH=254 /DNA_ID=CAMNT_0017100375 /DNA_START=12 /DNA_END=772 /DNA_ORIENTATION=+
MAMELRDCPHGIDRYNSGLTDESAPDAHVPLPGIMVWEDRKEEYHKVYMDELGKKLGMELDFDKLDITRLSPGERKRFTTAHHGKMELAASRITAAQEKLLQRLLNEAHSFRRHPVVEKWEKIICVAGADEYIFFKLPGALRSTAKPFYGLYIICHADTDHMRGDHVLMTAMENRLVNLERTQATFHVAQFRVDLDLAEMLLERLNRAETQFSVPLGQARHMTLAMEQSDMVGEMQEQVDRGEGAENAVLERLT